MWLLRFISYGFCLVNDIFLNCFRFESTNAELEAYRQLANKYRSDIYNKRKEVSEYLVPSESIN